MAQTQIVLSDTQLSALEKLAETRNISVETLLQESIGNLIQSANQAPYTETQKQRARDIIGRFKSGVNDLSQNHDNYLSDALSS